MTPFEGEGTDFEHVPKYFYTRRKSNNNNNNNNNFFCFSSLHSVQELSLELVHWPDAKGCGYEAGTCLL